MATGKEMKVLMNPNHANSTPSFIEKNSSVPKRDTWSGKLDFILTCVGFAVGLGNIWRFPYLCYKNGGGAFLIPYLVFLVFGGIPVFMLEIGLGQYMNTGSIGAWRIVPAFQGLGIASMVITFMMNIYYIVVLAWAVYYLLMSFRGALPWSHCNNEWNTERCFSANQQLRREPCSSNGTDYNCTSIVNGTRLEGSNTTVDSVVEFWERKAIRISTGFEEPGGVIWELALCLLFVWILVYFCVWRGIKWTGKVVYFTATFPYVVLTILLVRGVTLDGALDGIIFYLKPDFSRLSDSQVWIDGGTQIFFSYAIAIGAMISLGSYNKFRNNFYRDCIIIACINSGTSLYGGFAVFSVLGFMAREQNVSIANVAESGPGLVFIAYPKAFTQMPLSQLWSVLFFIMILFLGLGSEFVGVEGFLTPLADLFPHQLYKVKNRMIMTGVYCFISFLIGLSMVTKGGIYVFYLFDYYSASGMVLLWVCFFEAIAVGWIFGAGRFYDAIELMLGRRINPWLRICWLAFTPAVTAGTLLFQIAAFKPLRFSSAYTYPPGAQAFGLIMAISSMICIPAVFIVKMWRTPGSLKKRWRVLSTPVLKNHQIHPSWRLKPKLWTLSPE